MKFKSLLIGALLVASSSAQAALFTVKWSGEQFGNAGTALGHFNFSPAPADLGGIQNNNAFPSTNVQLIDLTVSGTSGGNGSFTEADFGSYYFASFSRLNYGTELIGQALGNGFNFGSFGAGYGGPSGDFNIFAATGGAPTGTFYFQLTASGGDSLGVVSIAPSGVPEPTSWALMIAGFGLMGVSMRRRRAAVSA